MQTRNAVLTPAFVVFSDAASIYELLDSGAAYDTVEDLIMAMDPSLVKLAGLPLSQYLK